MNRVTPLIMQPTAPPCGETDTEMQHELELTILMPCLNESKTLGACIAQAHAACQKASSLIYTERVPNTRFSQTEQRELNYEVLVADNGSSDGSQEIALNNGARLVDVAQRGYGAALMGGIAAARGKYIAMADCDCSYDFGDVPKFLAKLKEGYDLVVGNRFDGGIVRGAMPWHHQYIGNPVLSGLGRLLYNTEIQDWHCGLRAFDRKRIHELNLKCTGMEFASEMIIAASRMQLKVCQLPTKLHPDERGRPPHLRSFRDGLRHLRILLRHRLPVVPG